MSSWCLSALGKDQLQMLIILAAVFQKVYAQELMANADFRTSVKKSSQQGRQSTQNAEGAMYLGELLEVEQVYEMVGIFRARAMMTPGLKSFGYCQKQKRR